MDFVYNSWYVAGYDHEIKREALFRRTILGRPLVLYRTQDGAPHALDDRCSHRHAPLSEGRLVGDEVECPYHGIRFGPDGACTLVPSQKTIPPEADIRGYPVVERHRWVWVWMGDPAKADPDKIIDFHWNDDPDWSFRGETLMFPANYMLVVDNLLDLSHTTFLHRTTLGMAETPGTPINVERDDGSITVTRWVKNAGSAPLFRKIMGAQRLDRGQITNFTPPSFVRILIPTAPPGTGAPEGDLSQALLFRTLIAITPETMDSSYYFRSIVHNFQTDDPTISDLLFHGGHIAMEEDQWILGHQRDNMARHETRPWVDFNQDAGALQARRMVEALIAKERKTAIAAE